MKKKANRRADRSWMKCETNSHDPAMSANAAATRARWKVAISGRWRIAARWPSRIQNMNRYAVGLDSVVYRFCHAHAPSQPCRILAR